jgi:hypothetical protein
MNVPVGSPEIDLLQELPIPAAAMQPTPATVAPPAWVPPGTGPEALARLRMPGHNAPVSVPQPGQPDPGAHQARFPVNRRTPVTGGYGYGGSGAFAAVGGRIPAASNDPQRMVAENGEMKQLLQDASNTEQQNAAKLQELETVLTAKNHQIEELTNQLSQIEEQISSGSLAPTQPQKTRTELEEWSDELEKEAARVTQERKKLEAERKQLHEDEESLEKQMRTMEVSMAKERALIARQETELRRLHAEIQHELEIINRGDAGLREQMQKFQRRAQDVMAKPGPGGGSGVQGFGRR